MSKSDDRIVLFDTKGREALIEVIAEHREREVAKRVGCAQQQVSSWKLGKSRPKPEFRAALQRIFGIPSEAWLTRRERDVARGRPSTPPPPKRRAA